MELIQNAKAVRLRSSHGKYLTADEDQESVTGQDRNPFSKSAEWAVELVEDSDNIVLLRSCYGKYLTASTKPFLFGISGRRVLQTHPKRLDSAVEWKVIRDSDGAIKLKTGYGQFLRANGGLPPWRNSITHDLPQRTVSQESILWEVDVVDTNDEVVSVSPPSSVDKSDSFSSESSSVSSTHSAKSAGSACFAAKWRKGGEGRLIYFDIADGNGEITEGCFEEMCIRYKGNGVEELKKRLEWELGIEGITVCSKSPLNGLLYPLRLQLPPNNADMHIVVVAPSSS